MALEVGAVSARLGAVVDDAGFNRWEARVRRAHEQAKGPIEQRVGANVDDHGFNRYETRVKEAQTRAKHPVEQHVRANVDEGTFTKARAAQDKTAESSRRLGGAWVSARERVGPLRAGVSGLTGALIGGAGVFGLIEAVRVSSSRFQEHEKIMRQTEATIKSTGGNAHVTADEIDRLAKTIQRKSGIDAEQITQGANMMLTFRDVRNETGKNNDIFNQSVKAATDMSAAFQAAGKSMGISDAALQLGKALNDPEKGMTRLQRIGVTFNQTQVDTVKRLQESGDKMGAQRVILTELTKEFGGSANAAGKTFAGSLNRLKLSLEDAGAAVIQKLAPALTSGANKVATFVGQVQSGHGAGGKFRDVVVGIGKAVWAVLGPLLKAGAAVAVFVGHHPALLKLAGALIAVGLAVKAISFAGQITGITKLIGLVRGLAATRAGAGAAEEIAGAQGLGGLSGRVGRVWGRFKSWLIGTSTVTGAEAGAAAGAAEAEAMTGEAGLASAASKARVGGAGGLIGRILGSTIGKIAGGVAVASIIAQVTHVQDADPLLFLHPPAAGDPRPGHGDIQPKDTRTAAARRIGATVTADALSPTPSDKRLAETILKDKNALRDYGKQAVLAAEDIKKERKQVDDSSESHKRHTRLTGDSRKAVDGLKKTLGQLNDAWQGGTKQARKYADEVARGIPIHDHYAARARGLEADAKSLQDRLSHLTKGTAAYDDAALHLRRTQDALRNTSTHLHDEVDALRVKLSHLTKGTSAYHDTAEELRKKQAQLNRAVDAAKPAADHARSGLKPLGTTASNTGGLFGTMGSTIAGVTNKLLKDFGAQAISFSVSVANTAKNALGLAGGGIPHPGSGHRDDHVLLDPRGRPVAALSGTEGIVNTPQMGEIDQALAVRKALGLGRYGSLPELWSSGLRHHAGGGSLGSPLARASSLDHMHLPYIWGGHHGDSGPIRDPRPGLDCSSTVSYVLGIPPRVSGAFKNYGKPGKGPITIYANDQHVFMSLGGRGFGTSAENPSGGPGWLSYNSRPGFAVRNAEGAVGSMEIPRIVVKAHAGGGALSSGVHFLQGFGQRGADYLRRAGNKFLGKKLAAMDSSSGQPLNEGTVPGEVVGKVSTFGPPTEAAGTTASGLSSSYPGIAIFNHAGLNRRFLTWVEGHGHRANIGQTDVGPAPWTGRKIDYTGSAARMLGLDARSFPTDSIGHARPLGGGGLLRFFNGGGSLSRTGHGHPPAGETGGEATSITSWESGIAKAQKLIEHLNTRYEMLGRQFDLTDESDVVIPGDPTTGKPATLDMEKWNRHASELNTLLGVRKQIDEQYHNEDTYTKNLIRVYRTIRKRIKEAITRARRRLERLKDKKGKTAQTQRDATQHRIEAYQKRVGSIDGKISNLAGTEYQIGVDMWGADIDLQESRNEVAAWAPDVLLAGAKGDQAGGDTGAGDTGATDTAGAGDTGGATDTAAAPPSALDIATAAAEQVRNYMSASADLFSSQGANFMRAAQAAGPSESAIAAGFRYFGGGGSGSDAGVLGGAGGGGAPQVTQNITFTGPQPADPHTFTQASLFEMQAAL